VSSPNALPTIQKYPGVSHESGAIGGLKHLTRGGFKIVIISNQAGIGDGRYPVRKLREITRKMLLTLRRSGVRISGVFYCLHGKRAGCGCRKPKAGLFRQARRKIPFDRKATFYIGDKATDTQAAKRFGLKAAHVLTGYGRRDRVKLSKRMKPDLIAVDLLAAAQKIIRLANS